MVTIGGVKIRNCKRCGKQTDDLSTRFLCADCGVELLTENARQMKAKSGHFYDRWKAGMERMLEESE